MFKLFRFPSLPGEPSVEAQMNALVAQSDVFEVLFQSAFLEKTGVVKVKDYYEIYNWKLKTLESTGFVATTVFPGFLAFIVM